MVRRRLLPAALAALLLAFPGGASSRPHGDGNPRPRTAFMQVGRTEEGASMMRKMSLSEALSREGLATDATSSLEAQFGRVGLTLEAGATKKNTCIVLWAILVFSCCCLGGTGHSDDDGSASQMAGTLVPLGVLLYICFATDIVQTGLAGDKLNIWCALLCVWSIGQLICGCTLLFGLVVLHEISMHAHHEEESSVPKDGMQVLVREVPPSMKPEQLLPKTAPVDAPKAASPAPEPPAQAASSVPVAPPAEEPAQTAPDPMPIETPTDEPPAPPTPKQDASLTEEQLAMVTNVMTRTGATQEAAIKALNKNTWHGARAVKALQAKA